MKIAFLNGQYHTFDKLLKVLTHMYLFHLKFNVVVYRGQIPKKEKKKS